MAEHASRLGGYGAPPQVRHCQREPSVARLIEAQALRRGLGRATAFARIEAKLDPAPSLFESDEALAVEQQFLAGEEHVVALAVLAVQHTTVALYGLGPGAVMKECVHRALDLRDGDPRVADPAHNEDSMLAHELHAVLRASVDERDTKLLGEAVAVGE